MNEIVDFAESYWWLIFPVGAVVGGWAGSIGKYNEKRRKDKIELARIKANAQTEQLKLTTTSADQLRRVRKQHDALNEKWFAYELDLATLIEYPLMTDMREPLTLAFHRARVRADDLRPESDSAAGTAEGPVGRAFEIEHQTREIGMLAGADRHLGGHRAGQQQPRGQGSRTARRPKQHDRPEDRAGHAALLLAAFSASSSSAKEGRNWPGVFWRPTSMQMLVAWLCRFATSTSRISL